MRYRFVVALVVGYLPMAVALAEYVPVQNVAPASLVLGLTTFACLEKLARWMR